MATRQPEPDEWIERSVRWRLEAEATLHIAAMLVTDGTAYYQLLDKGRSIELGLGFARERPADGPRWPSQPLVRISLANSAWVKRSKSLWLDPRTDVDVIAPTTIESASVVTIARVAPRDSVDLVVLGPDDVRVTHGRWKADPEKLDLLPSNLEFVTNGRRNGQIL